MRIRKIIEADNKQVAHLVRSILEDMEVPKEGTAYGDTALDNMYLTYQRPKSVFYVIDFQGKIIGCGGIAPLEHNEGNLCELQKMYVSIGHRGKGLAQIIMQTCLDAATKFGFQGCYLETLPFMQVAQRLYQKNGFQYLQRPLGNTGHTACTVRMLKEF
ncbi:MAG: GNAT family N-acetyltransferase [Bacteroidota bacterium]